jgi:hypothetical protein
MLSISPTLKRGDEGQIPFEPDPLSLGEALEVQVGERRNEIEIPASGDGLRHRSSPESLPSGRDYLNSPETFDVALRHSRAVSPAPTF